jgi:hypothetical protein
MTSTLLLLKIRSRAIVRLAASDAVEKTLANEETNGACSTRTRTKLQILVVMNRWGEIFLLVNRRNSLKSPDPDEEIQGNPRIFSLVFLGFLWFRLVCLGLAWKNLAAG